MNAVSTVCAPSDPQVNWHSINWAQCHRQVKRLQARIVKAIREGRRGKVKALQWLLTHSFSAKALAVRRVTENQGKRTPGVDGETWSTPPAKSHALESLRRRGYQPRPLKRVYIAKANGKLRPLSIPTMMDRAQQALYLLALEPVAETTADPNSYGFRPERSTADAIEQCFITLAGDDAPPWILEGDIRACFDTISHEWLVANLPTDKAMLRKWLKAGFIEAQSQHLIEAGVPQGAIISPTIANMTLDGLETALAQTFKRRMIKRQVVNPKVHLVRYADDFVITGSSKELLEQEVKPLVEQFLKTRGLELSPEKTRLTHISEGFDFLGQNLRKYKSKLRAKPAKKNVQAFLGKVRRLIEENKAAQQSSVISRLNPVIRGWARYHQHVASATTFKRVDHEIWRKLWQWARRRHPQKGRSWIKAKYFETVGNRTWIFAAPTMEEGQPKWRRLARTSEVAFRHHRKIKMGANPFDPQWETYFEARKSFKMRQTLKGRMRLLNIWRHQGEKCPMCRQRITKQSGWHVHHIIPRCEGGASNFSNLVMVHPTCHLQIHHRKLTVVKPAL